LRYVNGEFLAISRAFESCPIIANEKFQEPRQPAVGQIEFADGTEWNPGLGRGFYGWDGNNWIPFDGVVTQVVTPAFSSNIEIPAPLPGVSNLLVAIDSSSGPVTATVADGFLPGQSIIVVDATGDWEVNNFELDFTGGSPSNPTYLYYSDILPYNGLLDRTTAQFWLLNDSYGFIGG
jgi:hypothetical protein